MCRNGSGERPKFDVDKTLLAGLSNGTSYIYIYKTNHNDRQSRPIYLILIIRDGNVYFNILLSKWINKQIFKFNTNVVLER